MYSQLKTEDFKIFDTTKDQWVFTRSYDILCVKYFVLYSDKRCYAFGSAIVERKAFFDIPIESDALGQKMNSSRQNYILSNKSPVNYFVYHILEHSKNLK